MCVSTMSLDPFKYIKESENAQVAARAGVKCRKVYGYLLVV